MEKSNFTVIEDKKEIEQAQLAFAKNMKKKAAKDGGIIVGYQGGNASMHAYWFKDDKFWWAYEPLPPRSEKIPRWWNAFGVRRYYTSGEPHNDEPRWGKQNSISCEINIPLSGNNWQVSGAFVKDQDNEIYIAHTGKIGGGRKGIGKTAFVDNFPGTNKWHQVSGSRGEKDAVIISNINDPNLIDNVGFFVKAVKKLKDGTSKGGSAGSSGLYGGDSIDEKFKAWLERGARKDGKSIEEYAKDLGKEEIEGRHKKFSELKKVLDEEPIDLTKISPVLEKAIDEHQTWMVLEPLEGNEISNAITALKEYKDETNIHSFLSIMNQARPPGREDAKESERRTGLETAQNLLIASACLTALHPSEFVDFRENRWQKLAKLIRIEDEFTPVKTCSDTKKLEEVGKFAKKITDTPTFKKYWSNQPQPLWTLAGICWKVKDDKSEGGDTDMDGLVEEILNMGFKLAIKEDVVKRVIRHLEGGKNVVLVGAPGVGKTELAMRVLSVVGNDMIGKREFHPVVAYAEWTRQQVIGGLNIEKEFEPGCVTIAAENNQWLLIDEFNRADINKAFGEMFLGIESNKITLSEAEADARERANKDRDITIPEEFRMVCTMNDFDKNLLLTELSYGLITRFAFVDIEPDPVEEKKSVQAQILKRDQDLKEAYADCENVIDEFYEFITDVRNTRMIGVRTCIDVIRYTASASKNEGKDKVYQFLDEALCDYLWPQFDRLDKQVIKDALDLSEKHLPKATDFREKLKKKYEELKKLFAWMREGEEEEKDNSGGGEKKERKPGKSESHQAGAKKAWITMNGYLENPEKRNQKTGLTGIEWAKLHPKNSVAKKIINKIGKKSSKKK